MVYESTVNHNELTCDKLNINGKNVSVNRSPSTTRPTVGESRWIWIRMLRSRNAKTGMSQGHVRNQVFYVL